MAAACVMHAVSLPLTAASLLQVVFCRRQVPSRGYREQMQPRVQMLLPQLACEGGGTGGEAKGFLVESAAWAGGRGCSYAHETAAACCDRGRAISLDLSRISGLVHRWPKGHKAAESQLSQ
jgi:hypothetical protein